jgi:hypothetical protein
MHTLLKGMVTQNLAHTATVLFVYNGRSMDCLADLDTRLKNSAYQQSVNPFSKKSKFRDGMFLICLLICSKVLFLYLISCMFFIRSFLLLS